MAERDSEKTKHTNHRVMENIVTIRILLVDDHWKVRERLRILLMKEPDFQLVGEAADGAEALEVFKKSSTDLVIMDLNIPEISGIETAKRILAYLPDTKVIIVTMQSNPHYVKEAFKTGVTGYLLKDCAFEELVEAVHTIAAGGTYVSPEIEVGIP
jgi:two-component system, NarL family, response regulator NreC